MPIFLIIGVFLGSIPAIADPIKSVKDEQKQESFQWEPALLQAGFFLGIQHGFRIATEPSSRGNLRGPFFKDYLQSASSVSGWADGDPPIVNYVGHPMMGAVTGYIYVQNDPRGRAQTFGRNAAY